MKIVYGIAVKTSILGSFKNGDDISILNMGNDESVCGIVLDETNYNSIKIDQDKLNSLSQENFETIQKFTPKLLSVWVKFIDSETERLKNDGLDEPEVASIMEQYEIGESVKFDFYVVV